MQRRAALISIFLLYFGFLQRGNRNGYTHIKNKLPQTRGFFI